MSNVPADAPLATLVRQARRGDPSATEALVRRHLRPAYAVALAIVQRPHDAEDLAQDALVVALERLDTCRDPERFTAWLLQIVRNRARNALESRRLREPAPDDDQPEAAGPADRPLERRTLLRALAQLSPVQREVVLLHDLQDWTHAEIGAALGITEVNSRQHLFQARRALRALLEPEPAAGAGHGT